MCGTHVSESRVASADTAIRLVTSEYMEPEVVPTADSKTGEPCYSRLQRWSVIEVPAETEVPCRRRCVNRLVARWGGRRERQGRIGRYGSDGEEIEGKRRRYVQKRVILSHSQ